MFDRAAFWALLLPASVHGRVADIWRGFVAQRVLRAAGLRLAFLPPGVTQLRNDHDALADYMSERPLYEQADAVVRVLDGVAPHRPGGSVARAVEDAYVALYEHGLVALDDVAYAQLWLADLYAAGLALPKLRRHKARTPGRGARRTRAG